MTGGASAVAWYAFADVEKSVTRITAESIAGMAASLRLAERVPRSRRLQPLLRAATKSSGKQHERIIQKLNELSAVTEGLKAAGATEARLANLIEIEGKIATELKALDDAVERRLRISAQEKPRSPILPSGTPSFKTH